LVWLDSLCQLDLVLLALARVETVRLSSQTHRVKGRLTVGRGALAKDGGWYS
jgi:hypothetical protein